MSMSGITHYKWVCRACGGPMTDTCVCLRCGGLWSRWVAVSVQGVAS